MKKSIKIEDFVYLLLGTLGTKQRIIDLNDRNSRIVSLPSNYKQIIQNILCAENGWKEMFACLIDVEEYFDNHFAWENLLARTLKKVLIDMNKNVVYDFERDSLIITFTKEEVDEILNRYKSDELKNTMDHFTNLLTDYIYTREYQEEHHDYSADSVKKMHDLLETKINEDKVITEINKPKTKTIGVFLKNRKKHL